MNNIVKFFEEKNIDTTLKEIKMKEFVEYCNKYIAEGLIIDEKYQMSGIAENNIHDIIERNIKKGLQELYEKYGLDYFIMLDDFTRVYTWGITMSIDYEEISSWETIGSYKFDYIARKNATYDNHTIKLIGLPIFELDLGLKNKMIDLTHDYNSMNIMEMSMYEFYRYLLEGQRQRTIANKQSELLSYKRRVNELKKEIEKLEEIII